MSTTYGSSQTYGTGSQYDRIDPDIAAAQAQYARQTGLYLAVVDSTPNRWEHFTGTAVPYPTKSTAKIPGLVPAPSQSDEMFTLQTSMCALSGGSIVRARLTASRTLEYQVITDPTNAAQWASWSSYTGPYYAVAVVPTGASTYNIYGAKSDGIYTNNSFTRAITGVVAIDPVIGQTGAMFVSKIVKDGLDKARVIDHYYTSNVATTAFVDDPFNYRWLRSETAALKLDDGRLARIHIAAFHSNPRSGMLAESMVLTIAPGVSTSTFIPVDPPRLIRGFNGQAGVNSLIHPVLVKLTDGYYYLFYGEARFDASKDLAISTDTVFWQRSKDLKFWSEPIAIGFDLMANSGFSVAEQGTYIWLANNGAAYRRLANYTTTYELSNYVNQVSFQIPRENQDGSGEFTVANPAGVNDAIKDFSDKSVVLKPGIRVADGSYKFSEPNQWWIDTVEQELNGEVNRLKVKIYDLWRRLENPLRDTYNFIGKVHWRDFEVGARNKLFNYLPRSCSVYLRYDGTIPYCRVKDNNAASFVLYTGWKGHNFDGSVRFRSGRVGSTQRFGLVYRWVDANNYYWAYVQGTNVWLGRKRAGTFEKLASASIGTLSNMRVGVSARFGIHKIYINSDLKITHNETTPTAKPGYVGVRFNGGTETIYHFYQFRLDTWETAYTTNDLIRTALAMGDFHDAVVAGGEDQQLAIVWGPQTDLNSPNAALRSLLDQHKLSLVWQNGQVHVGRFKELTPVKSLENEIIEASESEKTGRRINLAVVDGNEDSYIEIDGPDTRNRSRQIVRYFDLPDLKNFDSVRERAREEVRKGVVGVSSTGKIVYLHDLWRMDVINWTMPDGTESVQRIEGISAQLSQGLAPRHSIELDLSPAT